MPAGTGRKHSDSVAAQANSPDFGSAFGALLVQLGRFSPPTNSRSSGRFRHSSSDRDHRDVHNKLYAAVGVQCDRVTGACCGGYERTCTAQSGRFVPT